MTEEEKYEEYKLALGLLEFHQKKVEIYKAKTRAYLYAMESERVQNRKIESDKYYRELENKKK